NHNVTSSEIITYEKEINVNTGAQSEQQSAEVKEVIIPTECGETSTNDTGDKEQSPSREVSHTVTKEEHECMADPVAAPITHNDTTPLIEETDNVWQVLEGEEPANGAAEIPTDELKADEGLFTRLSDPFKPERVQEILKLVKIGNDLSDPEREGILALITEYADVFALSVSEVKPVKGAVHKLNIKPDAKFSTKIHQKPTTPPQKKYLHKSIDEMLAAGIIE
ncbi:hypothetical protein DXG01_014657, partial [Tephrocybe rancida]